MVPKIIIDLVKENRNVIPINRILELFCISKSTYYRWIKLSHPDSVEISDTERRIIELCKKHHYRYGYRKITALLRKERPINKNTVQRIMQKFNCQCRVKIKKNKKYKHQPVVMDNILDRDFKATRLFEKLVTDITYIPYGPKMLYLSTIMDLYNGEIIASTLSDKQNLECVIDTLN